MNKKCEVCGVLMENVRCNRRLCTRCQRAGQAERAKIRKAERKTLNLQSTAKPAAMPTVTDIGKAVKIVSDYNRRAEKAGEKQLSYGQYVAKFGL